MTFSTETDACLSQHTVFVLSLIPPILIVTVVILTITVFPPDFWLQEQITSVLPTPRAVRLQKMSERPVLPGDKCSFLCILWGQRLQHVTGREELPKRAGPWLWPWQEGQSSGSQIRNSLGWGRRGRGDAPGWHQTRGGFASLPKEKASLESKHMTV